MTLVQSITLSAAEEHYQQAIQALTDGEHPTAIVKLRAAIALAPTVASYHAHLGIALKLAGQLTERIACYRRAIQLDPAEPSYLANLSAALCEAGDLSAAEAAARQAIELDPQRPESHYNLGVAHSKQQNWRPAAESFSQAAERMQAASRDDPHPNHPTIAYWQTTAQAWAMAGSLGRAVSARQAALRAHGPDATPQRVALLIALAETLDTLCHYALAEKALQEALAIEPASVPAWNLLGNVQRAQANYDGAQHAFEKLLTLNPDNAAALGNLGTVCHLRGDNSAAIRHFRQTLTADPSLGVMWTNLGNVLIYALDHGPQEVRATFEDWDRQRAQPLLDPRPHPDVKGPGSTFACEIEPGPFTSRRLKIGYVSPDFRKHAVAYFALPLLSHHDKAQVDVFCYYNHRQQDEWTEQFKTVADHWRDVVTLDDSALAEQIRQDGIDILIDLSGHTEHNRLLAFARKPAPVQATWMGYVTTTGMQAMDWRITHADADPEGADADYTEKLIRLPGTMWCWQPLPEMPAVSPAPTFSKGHLTFGSFNRHAKNGPAVLSAWAEILKRVPDSHLLICVPAGASRNKLFSFFASHGIDAARINCFAKVDHAEFWRLHAEVDIALDPFPFGGGTTTCETLWLGVPLITCTGEGGDFPPRFASRMGKAFLTNIGHPELAAATIAEYIDKAVALANDRARLAELRQTLRPAMAKAPLTDAPRFAREMEAAYRGMWQHWCAAQHFAAASAHFQRGNTMREQGNHSAAIDSYRQALALSPNQAVIHSNLGNAFKDLGQVEAAIGAYQQALEIDPNFAIAHNNLGSALRELDRNEEAINAFQRAVRIAPQFSAAYRNLANTCLVQKDSAAAEHAYRQCINLEPQSAEPHLMLGYVCKQQGKLKEALQHMEQARQMDPENPNILNDQATVLKDLGRLTEALQWFEQAYRLQPASAEICNNLGLTCKELQRHHEAIAYYEQALTIQPELAEIHNNLGMCQEEMGRLAAAQQSFDRAIACQPDFAIAYSNRGSLLKDLGQYEAAIENFQRALQIDPDYLCAWNNLIFSLSLQANLPPEDLLNVSKQYGEKLKAKAQRYKTWAATADGDRPLRIGWVSGDLCIHPVGYFLDSVLTTLTQAHPDLTHVAYANQSKADGLTARLKSCCTTWHQVIGWNDEQLARQIHTDQIDILIDLAGHTAHNRLPVFAWKPAPVQVTWLGYFATTGVKEIDWLIADPWTLPESEEPHFTEKIWRLPETRLCFTPPQEDISVGPLPAIQKY